MTYEVTGKGRGDIRYYDANGEFIRLDGVRLPWRVKIRTDDPSRVMVMADNTEYETPIACSVRVGDRRPVTDEHPLGYQVTCTGR